MDQGACDKIPDVILCIQKLDFMFIRSENHKMSANKRAKLYMQCLNESHDQMLTILYNPNNRYLKMEQNPGHSKDLMYGVPEIFNSIFNQRISITEKTSNLSENVRPASPERTTK